MIGRGFCFLLVSLGTFVAPAQAQPITHPIWTTTPDAPANDAARLQFETAAKKRGLGPLEIVAAQDDAKVAAGLAIARGATFALLGQLHLGHNVEIDLRLINARTGELLDATAVPVAPSADSPELVAAVLRLDELASRTDLTRRAEGGGAPPNAPLMFALPPPRIPAHSEPGNAPQPGGWLQQRWPLVTAIAVAAGTALVLGIVVAKDNR
jgi:hypothetical protein